MTKAKWDGQQFTGENSPPPPPPLKQLLSFQIFLIQENL